MKYITTTAEREFIIEILDDNHVALNGVVYEVDFEVASEQTIYSLLVNNRSFEGSVYQSDDGWQVLLHGTQYVLQVEDEREKRLHASMGGEHHVNIDFHLRAPMPGLVIAVPISEGQVVQKGDVLIILESMKMQNEIKSPRAGKISRIRVKPGDRVEHKETLLSVV